MSDFNVFREKYRQHLAVIRYAAETIKRYTYFLNRFFAWLEAQGITEISSVTKELIQDYQTHLYETVNSKGEPNSVFHQNNTLKALKGFFSYLAEENYLVSDPARDISYARTPKRLPRSILTGPEAKKSHEIGHHVQNLLGLSDQVTAMQQRAGSQEQANELSVRLELQADCLAGVWSNRAAQAGHYQLEAGDLEEGLRAAAAIGDDKIQEQAQGYVVPESWTHGSSEMRVRWFRQGLQGGDPARCDTFKGGL